MLVPCLHTRRANCVCGEHEHHTVLESIEVGLVLRCIMFEHTHGQGGACVDAGWHSTRYTTHNAASPRGPPASHPHQADKCDGEGRTETAFGCDGLHQPSSRLSACASQHPPHRASGMRDLRRKRLC